MKNPGDAGNNIYPLTGIRGLAAIWVVLYHYRFAIQQNYPDWGALHRFIFSGYLGVDLFAFLSGFIISYTYCGRMKRFDVRNTGHFLWLRFVRTYPLHLFALALFVVVFVQKRGAGSLPVIFYDGSFLRQLFLVNGVGLETEWRWNVPSWSLSSEWLCYLFFPGFALVMEKIRNGYIHFLLAVIMICTAAWLMWAVGFPRFDTFLEWGFVRIVCEFLAGCWLFGVYRSGVFNGYLSAWSGLIALAGILIMPALFPGMPVIITITLFAMLVYALSLNMSPLTKLFGNRLMIYLGEISYSIYMLHWLILSNLGLFGFMELPLNIRIWAVLGTIIIGSALTYHFVENTSRKYLRGIFRYNFS